MSQLDQAKTHRALRIFNLDLHISVIQDFKNIMHTLFGSKVDITNWSISGHNWVFEKATDVVDVINQFTWRNINLEMIHKFQSRYDDFLQTFDAFVVTHSPVFCLIFETYNKPIILINSCRYEQPFSWSDDQAQWRWVEEGLARMFENGLLVPVSNNRADQAYLSMGTTVPSVYIPSLCLYTNASYAPRTNKYVCFGDRSVLPESEMIVSKPKQGYSWAELYSFKGIIHIPYEISTMSIFEQYSAGVPLWFPSKRLYKELVSQGKARLGSLYGKNYSEKFALARNMDFWLDLSDFYASDFTVGIHIFDSFEQLLQQLETFSETEQERQSRMDRLLRRKNLVLEQWRHIMSNLLIDV